MSFATHVGLLVLTLELPGCNTLKDKRRVLHSLMERVRRELHVSAAEVGFQNQIRSSSVAFAFVSGARVQVERLRESVERRFDEEPRLVVIERQWTWL
ncbi:MAG: hypothetical protein KatS3mg015_0365 [Fimbriimonadales bacterium]|nr:MAG: hypothetical protein KatS3mg015_0365 [Fimbriimonadales bacterium]